MEFVSKLVFPGVLVFIVIIFRPTIDSLLSRTTEAEFAGTKFKFAEARYQAAEQLSTSVDQALKSGGIEVVEATIAKFRKDAAGDIIRSYWKSDGTTVNKENQRVLRDWMNANGYGGISLVFFMRAQTYEDAREKAVRDLALAK